MDSEQQVAYLIDKQHRALALEAELQAEVPNLRDYPSWDTWDQAYHYHARRIAQAHETAEQACRERHAILKSSR